MNLKTIGLALAFAPALLPLAAPAQTTAQAPPRLQTTFTSPLKIVGSAGQYTVTPRGLTTEWTCAEGQQTEVTAGSPPVLIYRISSDGNVITATANGGSLKVDVAKGQFATAPTYEATDTAPMKNFATLGEGTPILYGTTPTSGATGFELLYSSAAGLTASIKTGSRILGVFTANANKWQIGFFPLDQSPTETDPTATPPPPARGDVVITGGACKASPVAGSTPTK